MNALRVMGLAAGAGAEPAAVLNQLHAIHEIRAALAHWEREAIREGRARGYTWQQLAAALVSWPSGSASSESTLRKQYS